MQAVVRHCSEWMEIVVSDMIPDPEWILMCTSENLRPTSLRLLPHINHINR